MRTHIRLGKIDFFSFFSQYDSDITYTSVKIVFPRSGIQCIDVKSKQRSLIAMVFYYVSIIGLRYEMPKSGCCEYSNHHLDNLFKI